MVRFTVELVVENKPVAKDPEGAAVLHHLIHANGWHMVESCRVGKLLRLGVNAESAEAAEALVRRMTDELRIFNPVAHRMTVLSVRQRRVHHPEGA